MPISEKHDSHAGPCTIWCLRNYYVVLGQVIVTLRECPKINLGVYVFYCSEPMLCRWINLVAHHLVGTCLYSLCTWIQGHTHLMLIKIQFLLCPVAFASGKCNYVILAHKYEWHRECVGMFTVVCLVRVVARKSDYLQVAMLGEAMLIISYL